MKKIWGGYLKAAGHPMASFVIGEVVSEDKAAKMIVAKNIIRILESPVQGGGSQLSFFNDPLFTVDEPTEIQTDNFYFSRVMTEETDRDIVSKYENFLIQVRAARLGLAPGLGAGFGRK